MSLTNYKRKRKFDLTAEPSGKVERSASHRFVVQKHAASRLHYDFRLEHDGVLKSWAVPHGPSLDSSVKTLAVQVEDHPVDYADFEGTIPAGQYGGGTVMVWDRGTWQSEEDVEESFKRGKLTFTLHGEKLGGEWTLVRMRSRGEENWLLLKRNDDYAISVKKKDILEAAPRSVLTGRDLSQIADGEKPLRKLSKKQSSVATAKRSAAKSQSKSQTKSRKKSGADTPTESELVGAIDVAVDHSQRSSASTVSKSQITKRLRAAPMGQPAKLFQPQLATLTADVPLSDKWLHEVKLDGYRILARIKKGKPHLITRGGLDWTDHFRAVADALLAIDCEDALLDGEVVALDANGLSDFQRLQNWMSEQRESSLVYYVFDLPYLDGHDLTGLPLLDRKLILEQLLSRKKRSSRNRDEADGITVRYHDHIQGSGDQVLKTACGFAMEGIVSKRSDSKYVSGRTNTWLKVKCVHNQEFVIAGYTEPAKSRTGFGALLLGHYVKEHLVYCGRVGTGFSETSLRDLIKRMKFLEAAKCPYAVLPTRSQTRGVTWLRPELVAEISYGTRTQDGLLRHAVFHGLREDKPAKQVVLEKPVVSPRSSRQRTDDEAHPKAVALRGITSDKTTASKSTASKATASKATASKATASKATASKTTTSKSTAKKHSAKSTTKHSSSSADVNGDAIVQVAGVTITHPDRIVYQKPPLTKGEVLQYLASVADWMLPGVVGRPITLVRCPQGTRGHSFYQKHMDDRLPAGVGSVTVPEEKQVSTYAVIEDVSGLISLAQLNAIEFHPWPALASDVERPDRLIFDLDPGEGLDWSWIVQGARDVRNLLKQVGLETFLRTTGGKGLHIVAPINPQSGDWDKLKEFAALVANTLASQHPDRYIATMSKAARRGKVFVDYLRNQRGATAVASYSPRARDGAGVSMPLSWRELSDDLTSNRFTIENAIAHIKRRRSDPWKDFDQVDQDLPNGKVRHSPVRKKTIGATAKRSPRRAATKAK